jgi:hypothetical protein
MYKKFILFSILAIGLFLTAGTQPSNACGNQFSISAQDDSYLPVEQNYDPCDYWVYWTFSLHRNTSDNGTHVVIRFEVQGAGVTEDFDSIYFGHGETKTRTGLAYVGPSTSNTIKISKLSGVGTKFDNLSNSVNYSNANGQ